MLRLRVDKYIKNKNIDIHETVAFLNKKGYKHVYELPKVKSILSSGFKIIDLKETSKLELEVFFEKQYLFIDSDKIKTPNNHLPHIQNAKMVILGKKIEVDNMNIIIPVKGVFLYPHTSYKIGKYTGTKKVDKENKNDFFVKKKLNFEFNTTLKPTDSKYEGSFLGDKKTFVPEDLYNNIIFKNMSIPRKGDQNQMIKSELLLKENFNLNFNFTSLDGLKYYLYNDELIFYLKNNNMDSLYAELVLTHENDLYKVVSEKNQTFQDFISNKHKIVTFKLKINLNDIKYNNTGEHIICVDSNTNSFNPTDFFNKKNLFFEETPLNKYINIENIELNKDD